ncbi:hypothetical protein O181_073226 [Austropuccinia psidii MF-1]|uniref:Uncharacterized protein n=1 Tax=Austropuccinia psidii MF-1 TaxID=1389203 RepID=A0A9Q3FAP9_9BASI|nr:hypothetical protein [Austropuccinia psidii MF-1]
MDNDSKPICSTNEVLWSREDRGPSEGLDTHVLQRTSPKDKLLAEKQKHLVRVPAERAVPKEGKQSRGSPPSLHKQEYASTSAKKGKEKGKAQLE